MVIAYPWSGRDWNRVVAISGRAAMPGLPGGSGFNWRSIAGTTGMMRPRGLGRLMRRRGLGQTDATGDVSYTVPSSSGYTFDSSGALVTTNFLSDVPTTTPFGTSAPLTPSGVVSTPLSTASVASGASANQAPWYASLLTSALNIGGQISNYELNPLTNKSTYIQTPQGGVIATNSPTAAVATAGLQTTIGGASALSTASLSSLLPLLLIGGVVLMMMKR